MSKVSVRVAAQLTGKSRETINAATKDGSISYTLNEKSHKVIDLAELQRVYPIVKSMEEIELSASVKSGQNLTASKQSDLEKQVAILEERLENANREMESQKEERIRERGQLESEIDNLRSSLERSQEQHNKALLLITDQSKQEESRGQKDRQRDEQLERLHDTIQELKTQNKRIVRRSLDQKKQLEALQNRKFWTWFIGK